jgi:hypothetical protein
MRETNGYGTYTGPTVGELFSRLSQDASLLARQEVQLAKVEMKQKAVAIAKDSAMVIAGGVVALLAAMTLVAFLVLGLAEFMEAWLAALLVGVALASIALILIQVGINKLKEANPVPEQTIESMRENQEWLKQQI